MTEFNPKLKLTELDNVCHRPHRRLSPPLLGSSQEHQACHCPGTIILYLENCLQPFRGTKISPSPLLMIDLWLIFTGLQPPLHLRTQVWHRLCSQVHRSWWESSLPSVAGTRLPLTQKCFYLVFWNLMKHLTIVSDVNVTSYIWNV